MKTLRDVHHRYVGLFRSAMRFPTYSAETSGRIRWCSDPVRYATMALAIETIRMDHVCGALAEIGVHRGYSSAMLNAQIPERKMYLFDTFEGFPDDASDDRFKNTSVDLVKHRLSDLHNVEFRVGTFPATASGIEEPFSFVLFDADRYQAALDCLNFFYPRMSRGAYFFLHDFNSPESDHAVARATKEFLQDKPELLIEIPDSAGTAVFRKS